MELPDNEVVPEIPPNMGGSKALWNIVRLQLLRGPNARQQQDLRSADRAGAQNDFAVRLEDGAIEELDACCALA